MNLSGRSLLTLLDYSTEEIQYLLDLAKRLKEEKKNGIKHDIYKWVKKNLLKIQPEF